MEEHYGIEDSDWKEWSDVTTKEAMLKILLKAIRKLEEIKRITTPESIIGKIVRGE